MSFERFLSEPACSSYLGLQPAHNSRKECKKFVELLF